jgi:hypothetical protein
MMGLLTAAMVVGQLLAGKFEFDALRPTLASMDAKAVKALDQTSQRLQASFNARFGIGDLGVGPHKATVQLALVAPVVVLLLKSFVQSEDLCFPSKQPTILEVAVTSVKQAAGAFSELNAACDDVERMLAGFQGHRPVDSSSGSQPKCYPEQIAARFVEMLLR